MARKTYVAKASNRLWGAVQVWAWLFMVAALFAIGAFAYRIVLLGQVHPDSPINEMSLLADYVAGGEVEVWTTALAGFAYLITYLIAAFLVLTWYLRSVRNAHALFHGIETAPAWTVWWFIIPVASLWKPYAMTSELWRSSQAPERWRGLKDLTAMRWWWAAVLVSGFAITVSNIGSRSAQSAGELIASELMLTVGYALQIVAGLLFLPIGRAITRGQNELIVEGRVVARPSVPTWSA